MLARARETINKAYFPFKDSKQTGLLYISTHKTVHDAFAGPHSVHCYFDGITVS